MLSERLRQVRDILELKDEDGMPYSLCYSPKDIEKGKKEILEYLDKCGGECEMSHLKMWYYSRGNNAWHYRVLKDIPCDIFNGRIRLCSERVAVETIKDELIVEEKIKEVEKMETNNTNGSGSVSDEAVREWGRINYPDFLDNMEILRAAYMSANGMPPQFGGMCHEVNLIEAQENMYVELDVLVAAEFDGMKYNGCPEHKVKMTNGEPCRKCGRSDSVLYVWHKYLVGDNTGKGYVKALSSSGTGIIPGKRYKIRGKVSEIYSGAPTINMDEYDLVSISGQNPVPVSQSVPSVPQNVPIAPAVNNDKIIDDVKMYLSIYGHSGLEIDVFRAWYDRSNFNVPIENILPRLDVDVKDNRIALRG